jgi:small-conductance mechanosensitive channel
MEIDMAPRQSIADDRSYKGAAMVMMMMAMMMIVMMMVVLGQLDNIRSSTYNDVT